MTEKLLKYVVDSMVKNGLVDKWTEKKEHTSGDHIIEINEENDEDFATSSEGVKYCNSAKGFGTKILTVRQRNEFKWYSSIWQKIVINIMCFLNLIYYFSVAISIWFLGMSLFFKILSWLDITKI